MKCTACGKECFDEQYPEVVFIDEHNIICEECSIDYEVIDGKVHVRHDLLEELGVTEQEYIADNCVA